METEKIVVGLDIGTNNVRVVVGKNGKNGVLEILGYGTAVSDGVIRGVITNIDKAAISIENAVKEAELKSNISIKVVNVNLVDRFVTGAIHKGGITRETVDKEIAVVDVVKLTKDMYRIVSPPGNEIIHVTPQNYDVDYGEKVKDPVGMFGVKLEADFHIITASSNAINNIYKCIRRTSLEVENIIYKPLAASLSVLSTEEKESGVCLIDIGGGTISLAIFHESIMCHCASLPFGSDVVSTDIKYGCMVTNYQAELLKTKFGQAIANKNSSNEIIRVAGLRNRPMKELSVFNLSTIIEARIEEIISFINTEIVESGHYNKLVGGIVISGGGAELKSIDKLFENISEINTRIGYPNENINHHNDNEIQSPAFATVTGLALAGIKALDYREEYYKSVKYIDNSSKEKTKESKDFFKKIWNKTRGFIMRDYEDTNEN